MSNDPSKDRFHTGFHRDALKAPEAPRLPPGVEVVDGLLQKSATRPPFDERSALFEQRRIYAKQMLAATDFVEFKARRRGLAINPAWDEWREKLTDIVKGLDEDIPPEPERWASALDAALEQARDARGDLFSDTDDITEKQRIEAERDEAREALKVANERIAELESREPEVRIVERVVEVSSPEAAPLKIIPDEIAAMMDPGDTFSPEVRRKLTERLNVELAELKNLRGLAGEDLKREAEIEKLLGLFARLGEI